MQRPDRKRKDLEGVMGAGNTAYEKELERLKKLRARHEGEWLTYDAAKAYYKRAERLPGQDCSDIGERRSLRIELQHRYGLTEIEAVNILNGYRMEEYAERYRRIRDLDVPLALWPVDEIYLTMLKNLGKYIKGQDEWFFDEDD